MDIEYIEHLEKHIEKLDDFVIAIVDSERTDRPTEADTVFYFRMLIEYMEDEIMRERNE